MPKNENKPQFKKRARSYMGRAVDTNEIRQSILIVCEGGKTEPNYFNQFHLATVKVKVVGTGLNTLNLVAEALRLREEDEYDQVWCVFDKDDFPIDHFDNAVQRAHDHLMEVAYSNQSFELWYLLHFELLNSSITRKEYIDKLSQHLCFEYKKNNPNMYQILRCRVDTAIKNAEQLLQAYQPCHPGKDDPSTTVHTLVSILLQQAKPLGKR